MSTNEATYEWLRTRVVGVQPSPDSRSRTLEWVTSSRSLAISRNPMGRIEVFVAGPSLVSTSVAVGELLEHDIWGTEGGVEIPATRVVLPVGEHFDKFAALVCAEMIDNDVDTDPQSAFDVVEPLIELALQREYSSDLTLMGLIGELALLRALLRAVGTSDSYRILRSWAGSAPSARDFQLGSVGVEVKTTQGGASSHKISGVHQVELGRSNEDVAETHLFMLSIGIGWLIGDNSGEALPDLVEDVLQLVVDDEDRIDLLARIKQYGGDSAIGYDHEQDRGKARYSRRFFFGFERLYDMTDSNLRLLRTERLVGLSNVEIGSVEYRVQLEDKVRGDMNPVNGWQPIAETLLKSAEI